MKTIKQIADELGVSKQKVYRFIQKNHINEVHQEVHHEALQRNTVKMYDEVAERLIKQGLFGETASDEAHQEVYREVHQEYINEAVFDTLLNQLETLQKELDRKNEQISKLEDSLMKSQENLEREQQLHLISQQKILRLETAATEETVEKESFWRRLFGR